VVEGCAAGFVGVVAGRDAAPDDALGAGAGLAAAWGETVGAAGAGSRIATSLGALSKSGDLTCGLDVRGVGVRACTSGNGSNMSISLGR
jgi:hypothetical protein